MLHAQQTFNDLLTCNEGAFTQGNHHRAYHLLSAAYHIALAENRVDYLKTLQLIARRQADWIKANLTPETVIKHGVKQKDFLRFYEVLAEQAAREVRIMEYWG